MCPRAVGCRRARPLCVPVGGGPPASRPRRELRSARRLEARPGPATAHRHRGRSLRRPSHRRRCVAGVWLGASSRSPARPSRRPRVPPPGPVGQLGRLSETAIAFAGTGRASTETAIAFTGAKWVFLVHFSGAEVMPVSRLPCWGRAVVLLVSMSPCCRASCAKKFAQRTKNGPKSAFCGVLGEFFRGPAVVGSHGASCVAPQPR